VEGAGAMIQIILRLLARRVVRQPPAPLRIAFLLFAVLSYGTTGFLYFELPAKPELGWEDGLWWSLVTMTTIGYGDLFPTTAGGRFLVAVPLMMFGIGLLGYVLSLGATTLVEAKNRELRGMNDFKLKDHLVIVNYPSADKIARIVDELRMDPNIGQGAEFVLVDDALPELPVELASRKVHFVRGNPARDETLRRASIDDARKAIILARPGDPRSDDHVLAITLAIEARENKVRTIVECVDVATEELLKKAGCDSIVCTSRFDAHFISSEVSNPGVQDVVDELLSHLTGQQLYFTGIAVGADATFGRVSKACRRRAHLAIGIRRAEKTLLNLEEGFPIQKGDLVISIGEDRLHTIGDD
jgi:voltage-gated potassium channel